MPQTHKVSCFDAAMSPTALDRGKRNAVQPQPSTKRAATLEKRDKMM